VEIKEAFIGFIQLDVKTAEIITANITRTLEEDGLNLKYCTGQSYDNQAGMAVIHSGVQKRILVLNPLAVFVPCNNHSHFGWCSCCSCECPGTDFFLVLWNICLATFHVQLTDGVF
jgi:hypothetical protein